MKSISNDNAKSEITIHEQIGSKKPSKVGSIIIDYEGKNFVEFEIKNSENEIDNSMFKNAHTTTGEINSAIGIIDCNSSVDQLPADAITTNPLALTT